MTGFLIGHPTGNPNSQQAALAYFERGELEAFCLGWVPSRATLAVLRNIPGLRGASERLRRRRFEPLSRASLVQDRWAEFNRLLMRARGLNERSTAAANAWLMSRMALEVHRSTVVALHCYEDCSLTQFEAAKALGKACIYELPAGYHRDWEDIATGVQARFAEWASPGQLSKSPYAEPKQKTRELELADLVIVPSKFAESGVRKYHPYKQLARTSYGVNSDFWCPGVDCKSVGKLTFLSAGSVSVRKGTPLLLQAWEKAGLRDSRLILVGHWALRQELKERLPQNVSWVPPCDSFQLREYYRAADVFVLPSFSDGFGLVILEAMACGNPVIVSDATCGPDVVVDRSGIVTSSGSLDELIEALRWAESNRSALAEMGMSARKVAQRHNWDAYRAAVASAALQLT